MKIELDRLQELGGRFSHIYQPQELSLDDEDAALAEPADVRGSIKRSGEAVDLRGELRATIEVSCGRCLKPVRIPVNADFEERLIPAVSWSGEPQHELTEDDLNLSVFDGEAIDLDELVDMFFVVKTVRVFVPVAESTETLAHVSVKRKKSIPAGKN